MSFFRWLYRLPGRINRSFGSTAVAANAEGPGAGVNQLNVPAASVVIQEIEDATSAGGDQEQEEGPEQEEDPVA